MKNLIKTIIGYFRYNNDKYIKHFLLGVFLYVASAIVLVNPTERKAFAIIGLFGWEVLNCWLKNKRVSTQEFIDFGFGAAGMMFAYWVLE